VLRQIKEDLSLKISTCNFGGIPREKELLGLKKMNVQYHNKFPSSIFDFSFALMLKLLFY